MSLRSIIDGSNIYRKILGFRIQTHNLAVSGSNPLPIQLPINPCHSIDEYVALGPRLSDWVEKDLG